jgi:predicted ATP-dependent endonuclease of OLD family
VYIKRIKIRNVRGFKGVDLDLSRPDGSLRGWTVLAGRNGSGKSTLLKAIALAISGPEKAPVLCESFVDWIRVDQNDAEAANTLIGGECLQILQNHPEIRTWL